MKAKNSDFYVVTISVAILVVMFSYITYFDFLKGSTFTTVTVIKDRSECYLLGYRWATVVNQKGDSLNIPVSEKLLFCKKTPFKATMKKSPRWAEQDGIVEVYIWDKEFWKTSFKVNIIKINYFSLYSEEVEANVVTENNTKLECKINRDVFLKKGIPFFAKAKFSRWTKEGFLTRYYFVK